MLHPPHSTCIPNKKHVEYSSHKKRVAVGVDMIAQKTNSSNRRLALIAMVSWLSMLGFDFFLHAGLLAGLYQETSPFLLSPLEAFKRIPLGYLSFLLLAVLLIWLMCRLKIVGLFPGLSFGMKLGVFIWGSGALGLLSVSTASFILMAGWFVGQT